MSALGAATIAATIVAALAAGTAGCSSGPVTGAPAGRSTPTQSPDATPVDLGPPGEASPDTGDGPPTDNGPPADLGPPASCARAQTWNTESKHVGSPGSNAPVYNVRVGQHPGECYDRINFDLNGPDEVGYFADYVTREQVADEGEGAPLAVPGNAFLRFVIIAPILGRDGQGHQPWRSPPKPGLQLLDPRQVQGWPTVAGVVYAGGHPNETTVLIGLQGRYAFNVSASWVNPKTQTRVVSVDIRRP
jgi:hypothetical protein